VPPEQTKSLIRGVNYDDDDDDDDDDENDTDGALYRN
jgi:hypothetical protein